MGTKERRQREFADRERLFLAKARECVCREGLLHLQMAKIADACDYATGTLYQHFNSKEDLVVAMLTEHCGERVQYFERAYAWDATARERMFAFALADQVFIERNPEFFRIAQFAQTELVWGTASQGRRSAYLNELRPAGDLAIRIVEEGIASDDLVLGESTAEEVALGVWSLVVGTHNLAHATGLLEFFDVDAPYRLMNRNIHHLLNGWNWQPLVDLNDQRACDELTRRVRDELFSKHNMAARS
jgi:AcrR family transcriptional regulator